MPGRSTELRGGPAVSLPSGGCQFCHGAAGGPVVLLLGPVDLTGASSSIGSRYQRALLALLALRAGTVVPTEEIIAALWPARVPNDPHASVHTYISRLRRVLGGHGLVLRTRSAGYELVAGDADVDARAFGAELAAARADRDRDAPASAVARLDRALRWWRGRPLADVLDWRFAAAAATRLDALRVDAEALRHRLALTMGRSDGAVAALRTLLDADPLNERVAGLLMWALYEESRQAEAFAVYRDTAGHRRDELGVDPGPWLRELHERMLGQRLTAAWVAGHR